ncbi:MAG TPA: CYTH domain-containing protein [Candidatus Butyricicoccus stercorigallinarum]|nr:CYTH domain-containing protein [Candidatus Butyricicoccus stercorigallinarum]
MEREFKWQIAEPADFDRIAESDAVQPLITSSGTADMEAIYYDTFDGQLAKAHSGLRLRRENGESVVCLKLAPQEGFGGAFKAREEYECYAPDIRSGMLNLPSAGAPQEFCDEILKSDLMELGRTIFTRRSYQLAYEGCTCELAFDSGKITHRGRVRPICEMELELKDGSEADFQALALALQAKFSLKPEPLSKLARMLRL